MPSILIQIDEPLLKALNRVAPAAKRQRAEFIRQAVRETIRSREYAAIREAYLRQPDSPDEADDWSNAEEWKQFEIWWAKLAAPVGRRPVLLRSRDDAYGVLNKFVAAEITATIRHIPIEVPLGKAEGLSKPCVVNCDNLRTISKAHLVERISHNPSSANSGSEAGSGLCPGVGRVDRVAALIASSRPSRRHYGNVVVLPPGSCGIGEVSHRDP